MDLTINPHVAALLNLHTKRISNKDYTKVERRRLMGIMAASYEVGSSRNLLQYVTYKFLKFKSLELRTECSQLPVDFVKITEVCHAALENNSGQEGILEHFAGDTHDTDATIKGVRLVSKAMRMLRLSGLIGSLQRPSDACDHNVVDCVQSHYDSVSWMYEEKKVVFLKKQATMSKIVGSGSEKEKLREKGNLDINVGSEEEDEYAETHFTGLEVPGDVKFVGKSNENRRRRCAATWR